MFILGGEADFFGRGATEIFFVGTGKVGGVDETGCRRDVGDGHVARMQMVLCFFETYFVEIFHNRHAVCFFEDIGKIGFAHVKVVADFVERKGKRVIAFEILHHSYGDSHTFVERNGRQRGTRQFGFTQNFYYKHVKGVLQFRFVVRLFLLYFACEHIFQRRELGMILRKIVNTDIILRHIVIGIESIMLIRLFVVEHGRIETKVKMLYRVVFGRTFDMRRIRIYDEQVAFFHGDSDVALRVFARAGEDIRNLTVGKSLHRIFVHAFETKVKVHHQFESRFAAISAESVLYNLHTESISQKRKEVK